MAKLPVQKGWRLTQQSFDRLLGRLDDDRELAGVKYETIRFRLIKFFEFRGTVCPEELADETINRVARKIDEGEEIRASDPYLYFHGVARMLLMQHWEKPERSQLSLDDLPKGQTPARNPVLNDEDEVENRLGCLRNCLASLPVENSRLIVQYYDWEKSEKMISRDGLSKQTGLSANALRIRCHRIREKLESCVTDCLKKS